MDELHEVLCFSCCALLGVTEVEPEGPEFCNTCKRTEAECFTCQVKQDCFDGININGPCLTEVGRPVHEWREEMYEDGSDYDSEMVQD